METNIFSDDTSLCYSHTNVKPIFETSNTALQFINEGLRPNKFFLNVPKPAINLNGETKKKLSQVFRPVRDKNETKHILKS